MVRSGGLVLLKDFLMCWGSGRRLVIVEWFDLKPCCVVLRGRCGQILSCMSHSSSFDAGQRRDIGRQEGPASNDSPVLGRVIIMAIFQMAGRLLHLKERLKMWQRWFKPVGPRCLRWRMVFPSGPAAVELPLSLRKWVSRWGVKGVALLLRSFLRIFLIVLQVSIVWVRMVLLVNYWQNAFEMSLWSVKILLLEEIGWLGYCVGFLPESDLMSLKYLDGWFSKEHDWSFSRHMLRLLLSM